MSPLVSITPRQMHTITEQVAVFFPYILLSILFHVNKITASVELTSLNLVFRVGVNGKSNELLCTRIQSAINVRKTTQGNSSPSHEKLFMNIMWEQFMQSIILCCNLFFIKIAQVRKWYSFQISLLVGNSALV